MKLIKNGNFVPWFRLAFAIMGLFIMYFSYDLLIGIWRYLGLLLGLVIGSIGAYSEKANTLRIKPFNNKYQKLSSKEHIIEK